uniref:uncharacterized protein n=1 Tax=Semicossyphus pulcher TaxID=241346 RepID=UPI0037E7413A
MTPPMFALYVTCLLLGRMVDTTTPEQSPSLRFVSAGVGEDVTLKCFYEDSVALIYYWYKQNVGQKLELLSKFYKYDESGSFYGEFKNNPRFELETDKGKNHLKIRNVQISDSATYYCISGSSYIFKFVVGTIIHVKGSGLNAPALIHQSASETIKTGASVTLKCTVNTGTCNGEHSVYWFKNPAESHPGLIYTQGGRDEQCEREPNIETNTCVYNLPMTSLNRSHAGTYYCAVASCGHILFGNGTKLGFKDGEDSFILVFFLSGALAFTTMLAICLAYKAYKMCKTTGECTDCQARTSASSAPNAEGDRDADNLHYAALRNHKPNRPTRQRDDPWTHCVYSGVRQMLKFYVLFVLLYRADCALLYANPGQNVTLQCFFDSSAKYLSWYKQVTGEQPEIISSFYKHLPDANSFHNQFKDNKRFSVHTGEGFYHLNISHVQDSDSATYYCGKTAITITEFQKGIFLVVKESSGISFILQSESDSVQPGGSVTLNCTLQTGTCDGEHSVYWFKNSEESHPGLIYTHGGRNDECESEPNSQTHTCVYNLPMKSLDRSHAGTYYCAVASCGHILFGNGTKLELEPDKVNFMSGALTFTIILVVLLAFLVCLMKQRNSCKSRESQATLSAQSTTNAEGYQKAHNLYYAALSVNLSKRLRRQRDPTWSECVYHSLKQ